MTTYCMFITKRQNTGVEHGRQHFAHAVLLSCGCGKLCINWLARVHSSANLPGETHELAADQDVLLQM